jgi:serine acetyltransferase
MEMMQRSASIRLGSRTATRAAEALGWPDGVTICSNVDSGERVTIGSTAHITVRFSIGTDANVGARAVVACNPAPATTAIGSMRHRGRIAQ